MVSKKPKAGNIKPKFLLDEGLPPRKVLKSCNQTWNIKHVRDDFGLGGATDIAVFEVAKKENRILITFNTKDFRKLLSKHDPSILDISSKIPTDKLDALIMKQVMSLGSSDLNGKIFKVTLK